MTNDNSFPIWNTELLRTVTGHRTRVKKREFEEIGYSKSEAVLLRIMSPVVSREDALTVLREHFDCILFKKCKFNVKSGGRSFGEC